MGFNPPDFWSKERKPKLKQLAVYDDWMMCQYVVNALTDAGFYAEHHSAVQPFYDPKTVKKLKGLYQPTCVVMVAESQYNDAFDFIEEWSAQL